MEINKKNDCRQVEGVSHVKRDARSIENCFKVKQQHTFITTFFYVHLYDCVNVGTHGHLHIDPDIVSPFSRKVLF